METASLPKTRILVVDDHRANRQLLVDLLFAHDFEVTEAEDGPEAISRTQSWKPDLILLDIAMPGMNGYETCQRIKELPEGRETPIIFISALTQPEDQETGFGVGGVDYITKPIRGKEVLARVANHLRIANLQRDLREQNSRLLEANSVGHRRKISSQHLLVEMIGARTGDFPTGAVLDKKYRLDEKIGEGGFGVVYRGLHIALNRPVAVKIFRPASEGDTQKAIRKFTREGILTSRVEHPNGVIVHDFGLGETGVAYLVMELLNGFTLRALLNGHKRISLARCAEILIPVCSFLAKVHAADIVHLDLKPENIFLHQFDHTEVIKVLDFGIAKTINRDDRAKMDTLENQVVLAGTLHYVAPESISGKKCDGKADMYSLGIMLFEMLTGEVPFRMNGSDLVSILKKHIYDVPPKLSERVPDNPPELDLLVARLLDKDPENRPSAAEFPELFLRAAHLPWPIPSASQPPPPPANNQRETATLEFQEREFEIPLD
jgi:serine/threonine protein kinase/CheY-like chemotaxis protein